MPARTLLVTGLLVLPLLGQPSQKPGPSGVPEPGRREAGADTAASAPRDAAGTPGSQDSPARPKSRADTVLIVKHRFDHREQIITGSVVMTCLALMMVVMNNYNPR
jgi:hypothetical protein